MTRATDIRSRLTNRHAAWIVNDWRGAGWVNFGAGARLVSFDRGDAYGTALP